MLTFGSLFSGIGGIDLGFERAGMRCRWQVEIDKYASQVLAKHWPDVPRWDDIRTFPPAEGGWNVDLICGGFPCQDISLAGKGEGIYGAKSGLFFELLRVVRRLHPRYVFLENVAALRSRGLDTVLGEMAALGFDAEWHCVPASAVGAPHQRDRIWIFAWRDVADAPCISGGARLCEDVGAGQQEAGGRLEPCDDGGPLSASPEMAYAAQRRQSELRRASRQNGLADGSSEKMADPCGAGLEGHRDKSFGIASELATACGSVWWALEPDVGRVAYGVPARVDRLKCLGNAVVPQVAELFGRAIVQFHQGG